MGAALIQHAAQNFFSGFHCVGGSQTAAGNRASSKAAAAGPRIRSFHDNAVEQLTVGRRTRHILEGADIGITGPTCQHALPFSRRFLSRFNINSLFGHFALVMFGFWQLLLVEVSHYVLRMMIHCWCSLSFANARSLEPSGGFLRTRNFSHLPAACGGGVPGRYAGLPVV